MKNRTRTLTILGAILLIVGAASAQEATARKLIKIEHANANEVVKLLISWVKVLPSRELGVIMVVGTPEQVAEAEAVIREVDKPRSPHFEPFQGSIELDAYFISAGEDASGGSIPPLVAPAVEELTQRFAYEHYGLLDSTLVRVAVDEEAFIRGQFTGTEKEPTRYSLQAKPREVRVEDGTATIRIADLEARWDIPYKQSSLDKETGVPQIHTYYRDLRIQTDVSIPEGKLVVVGKAGSPTDAQAIFLVLRARLVE